MDTGYSDKTLVQKLGIKEGQNVVILKAPDGYIASLKLPYDVEITNLKSNSIFIHFFTKSLNNLESEFPKLKLKLAKSGSLWISWPKKTSPIESNLDENIIRELGLKNGLVDVKVISIDQDWSGLKFVYRKKDR